MKLKITYYALFREQANKSEEVFETQAQTPAELYKELAKKYGFHLHEHQLKVAINDEFCGFSKNLSENDNVVFIPPVAGG